MLGTILSSGDGFLEALVEDIFVTLVWFLCPWFVAVCLVLFAHFLTLFLSGFSELGV